MVNKIVIPIGEIYQELNRVICALPTIPESTLNTTFEIFKHAMSDPDEDVIKAIAYDIVGGLDDGFGELLVEAVKEAMAKIDAIMIRAGLVTGTVKIDVLDITPYGLLIELET